MKESEDKSNNDLSLKLASIFEANADFSENKSKSDVLKSKEEIAEVEDKKTKTKENIIIDQENETSKEEKLKSDEKTKPDEEINLKKEYEFLQKQLNETKSWGHKKNVAHVNAKKKITEFLNALQNDSLIGEEEVNTALSYFELSDDDLNEFETNKNKDNPYRNLRENLDKEFTIFKKYSRIENAEEKYQAYFSFLPALSLEEQEKAANYMMNETPEIVIDHIMTLGTEIYDNLYKGVSKHGGTVPYLKYLNNKINKLEKRNKELEEEVDLTEGTVYSRSINSKVSKIEPVKQNKSLADIWQQG